MEGKCVYVRETAVRRAGQYDSIIVIPRYVNSPILISKAFLAIRFYCDRYCSDITIAENGGVAHSDTYC